jgi:hypothetical protein
VDVLRAGHGGAFLFYSGNLLWIEARRKRHKLVQPRSGKLMAQATLGVCLGCVAGVSAVFVANKLGPADSCRCGRRAATTPCSSAACCGLSPSAGACGARAAHAVRVLTLAVPLAHWWRTGLNPLLALLQGDGCGGRGVVSYCLRYCTGACAAARGQHGDPHSVWSLHSGAGPPGRYQQEIRRCIMRL